MLYMLLPVILELPKFISLNHYKNRLSDISYLQKYRPPPPPSLPQYSYWEVLQPHSNVPQ